MEDEKIIQLFFERSQQAISQLAEKYEKLIYGVSYHILNDEQDCLECVNDTYLAVWNAIPPEKPDPLSAYICRIAKNLSLTRLRNKSAKKRDTSTTSSLDELEAIIPSKSTEEEWSARELGRKIDSFLDTLPKQQRVLFVKRYWFLEPVNEIAKEMGMRESAVSVRLHRIKKKLKDYLQKEGFSVE